MLRGRQSGLALVEMLIAIVLMSLVAAAFYELVGVAARGWGALEGQLEVQQQPRLALGRIAGEVRQARDFVIGGGGRDLGLGKATLLRQDAPAGATAIEVEDAAVLAAGRPLIIQSVTEVERVGVASIAGATVALAAPLARSHRRGEAVRRGGTALSATAFAGLSTMTVNDGAVLASGDLVAVGDEGPLTVLVVTGNTVTLESALSQTHAAGEVVQPLAVMFRCEGSCLDPASRITRCTGGCGAAANRVPLADLVAAPSGRPVFAAVASSLTGAVGSGATTICPLTVSGFAVGDRVVVGRGQEGSSTVQRPERRWIVAVGGGCLTLDRGLLRAYPAGTPVRVPAVELALRAFRANDSLGGQVQEVIVATKAELRN
jgi:prepilin-type N-terminal cleavage/methylation domain-containing protein